MKKVVWASAFILLNSHAIAYNLFPDSSLNRVNLRITNTGGFSIPAVRVTKQSLPSWVTGFSPNEVNLSDIAPNQSATATFTFNIPANTQAGLSGDISLQITSTSGETFSKNIALAIVTPTGAISGSAFR